MREYQFRSISIAVCLSLMLGVAVGNLSMEEEQIFQNVPLTSCLLVEEELAECEPSFLLLHEEEFEF